MKNGTKELTVLVPAKDEEGSLPILKSKLDEAAGTLSGWSFRYLFVDDGSTDGTWQAMQAMAAADPAVRCLRLRRNFGKSQALAAGVAQVETPYIVTMDADLQDDPAELPQMLAPLETGAADFVAAWRETRNDPKAKTLPSRLFNGTVRRLTGIGLHDFNCGFKAARTEIYKAIPLYGELHRYIPVMAHDLGYRLAEVPVQHHPRVHGRSKFGMERHLRGLTDLLTVLTITRFGRRPGHLFGGIGIVLGLIGALILAYMSGVWLFTDRPIGTRPLLQLGFVLEIFALQFIAIGLLAELILYRTTSENPDRFVAEDTAADTAATPPATPPVTPASAAAKTRPAARGKQPAARKGAKPDAKR